jgi:Tol biopolymer transport system component
VQPTVIEPETMVLLPGLSEKPQVLYGTNSKELSFDWMPDSKRILVGINSRGSAHGIGVFRTDETRLAPQAILSAVGYTVAPKNVAVSPDGQWVAFELYRLSSAEDSSLMGIAVMPINASTVVAIRTPGDIGKLKIVAAGDARKPQWSPDSKRILYSSPNANKSGNDLFVVSAGGGKPVNLTNGKGDNFEAVWSPARK